MENCTPRHVHRLAFQPTRSRARKRVPKDSSCRYQTDVNYISCKRYSTTHLQSCSQINVQFLTTLNFARASPLCNKISAECSACAPYKSIRVPSKAYKIACVDIWKTEGKFHSENEWAWLIIVTLLRNPSWKLGMSSSWRPSWVTFLPHIFF